jgi:hypothetical protein
MPETKPLTEYRENIARSGKAKLLRTGIVAPNEAEENRESMDLKAPKAPIIVRVLGKVVPIW